MCTLLIKKMTFCAKSSTKSLIIITSACSLEQMFIQMFLSSILNGEKIKIKELVTNDAKATVSNFCKENPFFKV